MENASKALIMVAGMLIAILIISLLLFVWSRVSELKDANSSLIEIENTAKFNEQFTNYDRDDVQGYELLSLLNKIIDYNERTSNDKSQDGNDKKYPSISISIDMSKEEYLNNLRFDNVRRLFETRVYIDGDLTGGNDSGGKFKRYSLEDSIKEMLNNCKTRLRGYR